jgi:hypothetical protein
MQNRTRVVAYTERDGHAIGGMATAATLTLTYFPQLVDRGISQIIMDWTDHQVHVCYGNVPLLLGAVAKLLQNVSVRPSDL